MSNDQEYDIVVIGSGPGGSTMATEAAKAGKKVAVIDELFGGTCAIFGCTPKKAMETVSTTYWQMKALVGAGATMPAPLNWSDLMSHKAKFTTQVPQKTLESFKEKGIECIQGKATFLNDTVIEVNDLRIRFDTAVIATGAQPRTLEIEGAKQMITSDQFFELKKLPLNVIIIGGGYIGFELSHIMAACGAQVTILNDQEEVLSAFDQDLVAGLIQATFIKGIDLKLGVRVHSIFSDEISTYVTIMDKKEREIELPADLIINASGRVPATAGLNLEKLGIKLKVDGGLEVDQNFSVKGINNVYAIGDVLGENPFTEAAEYEAQLLAGHLLKGEKISMDTDLMPVVVYTYPKLAMVGQSIEGSTIHDIPLDKFFTQRTINNAFAKAKVESKYGAIKKVSILGYKADDMVNTMAVALQSNMSVKSIQQLLLGFPAATHDVKYFVP